MTSAQSVSHSLSVTKGSTTQHDDSCEDVHCLLSLLILNIIPVQNQFTEKITAATQKVMWQKGFYPGDTEYDMIAVLEVHIHTQLDTPPPLLHALLA